MIGSQMTDCLTACGRVLVKVIVHWLTNKLSTFYQTQSFTMSARAATCPCPEPDQSSQCLPSCYFDNQFSCYPPFYAWVFQMVFPFGFPEKKLCNINFPMHVTYPSYLSVCLIPAVLHSSETFPF